MSDEWQKLVEAIRAERAAETKEERERLAVESERLAREAEHARDAKEKGDVKCVI
jgi:hypothetical protein